MSRDVSNSSASPAPAPTPAGTSSPGVLAGGEPTLLLVLLSVTQARPREPPPATRAPVYSVALPSTRAPRIAERVLSRGRSRDADALETPGDAGVRARGDKLGAREERADCDLHHPHSHVEYN